MSDLKLTDIEWKIFNFIDLFDIKDGYYNKKPPLEKNGTIPFLGATQYDNGITGFYSQETIENYDKVGNVSSKDKSKRLFQPNCLAVTNNGSVGNVYYQEFLFTCSHDITVLYLKKYKLNKFIAKFLIPLLQKSGESFEYGKKWRPKRMKKSKLQLPIDSLGQPNWQFMEDYIKQEQKKQALKLREYYEKKFYQLAGDLVGLEEVKWKEFRFTDVFTTLQRGKRLAKHQHIDGDKPYVSSTSMNNGLDGFIGNNKRVREFEDCLTIANSGSVGSSFYHHYKFIASDHVTALKNEQFSKEIYLFLATMIKRLEQKYSFNREINDSRISRERVLLPVDINGQPNWQYMSDFVKKIELDKIEKILSNIYIYIYRKIRVLTDLQLNNRDWRPYILEQVCEILSGQDIYQQDRIVGKIPYLTSTENNNGIGYFVSNSNKTLASKCISINRNGSVGEAFYHEYSALYGNDTRKLIPRHEDKYSSLFITQVLRKQKNKYGYGYKMGTKRLKSQKIMLPVDSYKEIDYQFMSHYMKLQEFVKIYHILNKLTFKGD